MRFRFSLESILKLRQNEEEEARLELVKIRNEIAELENKLSRLNESIKESEEKRLKALSNGATGSIIRTWDEYIQKLRIEKIDLLNEIEKKREEESEKLRVYLEKRKERMALEKLKERKYKEYLENLSRQERKFLDEVAEKNYWRLKFK